MTGNSSAGQGTSAALGARFVILARVLFFLAVLTVFLHLTVRLYPAGDAQAPPNAVDFTLYWAAAKLSFLGQPLAVFDREALIAAAGLVAPPPEAFVWLYPPLALVLMTPLGALSYAQALLVYAFVSVGALWASLRAPGAPVPGIALFVVSSPVVVVGSVMIGQIAALLTAAFVGAIWMTVRGKPIAAGFLLGLLTIKPQLGLLIPIALAAGGYWRALGWAAVFAAALHSAATAVTGIAFWTEFFQATAFIADIVDDGDLAKLHLKSSVYGFIRIAGLAAGDAMLVEIAAGVIAALLVAWVWSRPDVSADLKCATLLTAAPLATPYAYYYVTTYVLAGLVFLIRDGFGRGLVPGIWIGVLWLGPLPGFLFPELLPPALTLPPVILATFGISIARAVRARPSEAQPSLPRG